MNLVGSLFGSSIGRKFLMAVSGLILIGFVVGHLVGNLQIFQEPDHINGYAEFLRKTGPTIWIARLVILAAAFIHIWAATVLTIENKSARPKPYGVNYTIRATLASRTMRWTGVVVLAFIFFHLAHFTWGGVNNDTFKESLPLYSMSHEYRVMGFPVIDAGEKVHDVHTMVIRGFQHPVVSLFYIIAVGLLSLHLLHGFDSMFQTFGLRSTRWSSGLRKIAVLFCALYFLGNLAIPGAVLAGKLQPRTTATATSATHR